MLEEWPTGCEKKEIAKNSSDVTKLYCAWR